MRASRACVLRYCLAMISPTFRSILNFTYVHSCHRYCQFIFNIVLALCPCHAMDTISSLQMKRCHERTTVDRLPALPPKLYVMCYYNILSFHLDLSYHVNEMKQIIIIIIFTNIFINVNTIYLNYF